MIEVYFTCKRSNYAKLTNCGRLTSYVCVTPSSINMFDYWNEFRNALKTKSKRAAIYHPPCKNWSILRGLSNVTPVQRWLAIWSLIRVRRYGGILEHPEKSLLFKKYIKLPGQGIDEFGGFSIATDLHSFGFPAKKKTWLYIVGCTPRELPPLPMNFNAITHVVGTTNKKSDLKELSKSTREKTPIAMCLWLAEVIRIIEYNQQSMML